MGLKRGCLLLATLAKWGVPPPFPQWWCLRDDEGCWWGDGCCCKAYFRHSRGWIRMDHKLFEFQNKFNFFQIQGALGNASKYKNNYFLKAVFLNNSKKVHLICNFIFLLV